MSSETFFQIESSAELGRFLVASERIPAGSVILAERPLVASAVDLEDDTVDDNDKALRCLGCFKPRTQATASCTRCGWPVCTESCVQSPHHLGNECEYFAENGITFPLPWPVTNKTILIFRCYLVKRKNPKNWTELLKFEDHSDTRAKKKDCVKSDAQVLRSFAHFFGRELTENETGEVKRLCGIVNVNAFTSLKHRDNNTIISQCVFLTASLFNHSCVPNSTWQIGDLPELKMTVRTAIDIEKGQMLTIPYSARENLAGTLQRLVSTEEVAHFQCRCDRCRDPTELDTFISAVKCLKPNCHGYLLPLDPTNPDSAWKCRRILSENDLESASPSCGSSVPVRKIVSILYKAEADLKNVKKIIPADGRNNSNDGKVDLNYLRMMELKKMWEGGIFHENHYLVQEISLIIVKYLANYLDTLSKAELECFISCCERLLTVADVITPGLSPHRTMLQFYLARGLKSLLMLLHGSNNGDSSQRQLYDACLSLDDNVTGLTQNRLL